ncbi:MAG: hypothetical protein R6V57_15760 [Vicinamibacterales bacterium]
MTSPVTSGGLRVLRNTVAIIVILIAWLAPAVVAAQTAQQPPSAEQLAKQTQNPVSSLISFPLQANWDFGLGDREAVGTIFNIQPVVPFAITPSTNIILRVIMPLTSQPGADGVRVNGLGDVVATAFFSPAKSGRIIWGAGPVFLLPAATNTALGTEKFAMGPSVVALTQPGPWTVGLLFNHLWSTSGATDRDDVNSTFLQPFVNYNLGRGLAVGAVLEATANWEAEETWTAPLLFTISKVALLGKRPVNFIVGAGPTVASPEGGANWRFRFAAIFMFPR